MFDDDHTLGAAPIEEQFRERMQTLARVIDGIFNGADANPRARGVADARAVGFVLLVFPFGHDQDRRCNFISNGADRGDIVALFREMIARFEDQAEDESP